MRLLLAILLSVVLTAGLAPVSAVAQTDVVGTMDVSEVKPGMQGFGLTVFRDAKRDRFTFQVLSVVPNFAGWPKVIVVEIADCPDCTDGKNMLEHHQIYGGMSGSPMYVVDDEGKSPRLIGGLAMAKDFATTNKALITPWKFQEDMASKLKPRVGAVRTTAEPGDFTSACLVYGARDDCFNSTITARHDGRLFTTSHDLDIGEETLPYGNSRLPVFLTQVAELLDSSSGATKLTGDRIAPIGTVVIHGKFGFVVDEGELPTTVPVSLTINGVFDQPALLEYHMAYHKNAPRSLVNILATAISQLPDNPPATSAEVTIRLTNPHGVIRYVDSSSTGLLSLKFILERLIAQERDLNIEGVNIVYAPSDEDDLWKPVNIQTTGKGADASVTVLARRFKDNETEQISEQLDARFLKALRKKDLYWWDGPALQNLILSLYPVRASFALLSQFQERERLYLVYAESDEEMVIPKNVGSEAGSGAWKQRLPEIRILASPVFSSSRFFLPPDKEGAIHAVPNTRK